MAMQQGPPRRRRARPVGDAPVDGLLLRGEDLAKGWLLALLEQVPLEAAAEIPAAELARDAPLLCETIVRSLASDTDLGRLEPGGALEWLLARVGPIAGARDAPSISRAVDALAAVVWSGVREELARPDPDQVSELSERLALVIEHVRRGALRQAAAGPGLFSPHARGGGRIQAVPETRAGDEPGPGATAARGTPGGLLWVGALSEEIDRARTTGGSLSLLLIELEEADRVAVAAPAPQATFGRFAQAVRSSTRRQDIVACETEARAWVMARETGRTGAEALAARIAAAVREGPGWHGAAMTVSTGIAVYGEDGTDVQEMIDAAERARFEASSAGIVVTARPAANEEEAWPGEEE